MPPSDDLVLPSAADDEKRASPLLRALAELIGTIGANDGFLPPRRLELVMEVVGEIGTILQDPSLLRVLVLRTLSAPKSPRGAVAELRAAARDAPAPMRVEIMRELARLLTEARPSIAELGPDIAAALSVPLPEPLRHPTPSGQAGGTSLVERARRLIRSEAPLVAEARGFGVDFARPDILSAVETAQRTGDMRPLVSVLPVVLDTVTREIETLVHATENEGDMEREAAALEAAAERMKRVADQRYAAITRRARMLKVHLREDLDALVEDGVEEFEVDLRRLGEDRKWFSRTDSESMNERLVVKNLERRYRNLARRYQEELDLLSREVAEFCDEFTQVGDDALRPLARHEFRAIAPHPGLIRRVKVALDRTATGTLLTGGAAAAAGGAAMQAGLLSGAAVATAALTPVAAAVLGAVALAGVWKLFASPADRRRRDVSERARALEQRLRAEIMGNYPRFCEAVDAIIARFQSAAVPDISRPRIEAERVREIAASRRIIARQVADTARDRVDRMLRLLQDQRGRVAERA